MGSGSWNHSDFLGYSRSVGKSVSADTGRVVSGQVFESTRINEALNPRNFEIRECVNSDEHPNTIPIILALDVTGSMGKSCQETAEALGVIMTDLYKKYKDIEFCVMGIGDLAYDEAPIQMSQFESDIRIAEALDKIYMEHGGGGNAFESYTAAWYMGLKKTKLDCFDKQNRKGIIITMGDEPMNPYLPKNALNFAANVHEQGDIETENLWEEAVKKFNIFHIAVEDSGNSCSYYKGRIKESFGQLMGDRLIFSSINDLAMNITKCIDISLQDTPVESESQQAMVNENGEIQW